MTEVSDIIEGATQHSLIILDEIGRGTSTFDGMSIARAVLEYISDPQRLGAKTLFSTHYHELTILEDLLPGVKNYNVTVKRENGKITFLRKIAKGGADDSYGVEVAGLAGLPDWIINRANEILSELEANKGSDNFSKKIEKTHKNTEIFQKNDKIIQKLKNIDPNELTPIEALNILSKTCQQLEF
jgi:DNA mismatch repair protein MutS